MNPTDQNVFAKALRSTMAVFNRKVTEEDIEVWFRALKEYPVLKVQDAFDAHAKYAKFAPKPGDIVGRLNGTNDRGEAKEASGYHRPGKCEAPDCPNPPASFDPALCHAHVRQPQVRWEEITRGILGGHTPFPLTHTERHRAQFLVETGRYDELKSTMRPEVVLWAREEVRAKRLIPDSFAPGSVDLASALAYLQSAKRDPGYLQASVTDG